jgi:hypothetical protein
MQIRPAIARSMITGRKSGLRGLGCGKDYCLSFDSKACTAESSLTPRATIRERPVRQRPLQLHGFVRR